KFSTLWFFQLQNTVLEENEKEENWRETIRNHIMILTYEN
ncbi:hypothetical protein Avbf_00175, partial [Armadillidium vulgare]